MLRGIKKFLRSLLNLREWIDAIIFALIVGGLFRTFAFEAYTIPTGSMIPTLQISDKIFVSKYAYGFNKYSFIYSPDFLSDKKFFFKPPDYGDIVLFRGPLDPHTTYIKRLIGKPGDKVQLKQGVVYVNDKAIPRTKVSSYQSFDGNTIYQFQEEHGGVKYIINDENKNLHLDFPDTTKVYQVPEGYYFMLGDNRNRSVDSRFQGNGIGFVPANNIIGKALVIFDYDGILGCFTDYQTCRFFQKL